MSEEERHAGRGMNLPTFYYINRPTVEPFYKMILLFEQGRSDSC